jgi:hypothetical protein
MAARAEVPGSDDCPLCAPAKRPRAIDAYEGAPLVRRQKKAAKKR